MNFLHKSPVGKKAKKETRSKILSVTYRGKCSAVVAGVYFKHVTRKSQTMSEFRRLKMDNLSLISYLFLPFVFSFYPFVFSFYPFSINQTFSLFYHILFHYFFCQNVTHVSYFYSIIELPVSHQ